MRRFLADCSHELRSPLARIRSTIDVLKRVDGEEGPDEVKFRSGALADIAAETDRMTRMVRQLLILARADAGASIELRPVASARCSPPRAGRRIAYVETRLLRRTNDRIPTLVGCFNPRLVYKTGSPHLRGFGLRYYLGYLGY